MATRKPTIDARRGYVARQVLINSMYRDGATQRKEAEDYARATILANDASVDDVNAEVDTVMARVAYERAKSIRTYWKVREDAQGAVQKLRTTDREKPTGEDAFAVDALAQEMRNADADRFAAMAERAAKMKAAREARAAGKDAPSRPAPKAKATREPSKPGTKKPVIVTASVPVAGEDVALTM